MKLLGLEHALIGAVMGALVAIAVRPFQSRIEAARRLFVSTLCGTLSMPIVEMFFGLPESPQMRVALGFFIAVWAWYVLGIILGTLEARKDQDAIKIAGDIMRAKNGGSPDGGNT